MNSLALPPSSMSEIVTFVNGLVAREAGTERGVWVGWGRALIRGGANSKLGAYSNKTVCRHDHSIKPLSEDSRPDVGGVSWISEHFPSRKTAVN